MAIPERDYMTIGQVVEKLQATYADLSISKIRFLEEEGLISPERTAGGYRKFRVPDVTRLELILKLQREHYMPLSVIREKLREIDQGRVPEELKTSAPEAATPAVQLPMEVETVPLSSAPAALGLPVSFLRELEEYGLIAPIPGESGEELSRLDVEIAHSCWDLRRYGVEPRHLKMYENFSQRESALFAQILMPQVRARTPEAQNKLGETVGELSRLSLELKRLMLRRALSRDFESTV